MTPDRMADHLVSKCVYAMLRNTGGKFKFVHTELAPFGIVFSRFVQSQLSVDLNSNTRFYLSLEKRVPRYTVYFTAYTKIDALLLQNDELNDFYWHQQITILLARSIFAQKVIPVNLCHRSNHVSAAALVDRSRREILSRTTWRTRWYRKNKTIRVQQCLAAETRTHLLINRRMLRGTEERSSEELLRCALTQISRKSKAWSRDRSSLEHGKLTQF